MWAERRDQIRRLSFLDAVIPLGGVSLDATEEHNLPTVDVSRKLGW